jgi:hypothetical protein
MIHCRSLVLMLALVSFFSCREKDECEDRAKPTVFFNEAIKGWSPYTGNANIVFENAALQTEVIQLRNFDQRIAGIFPNGDCPANRGDYRYVDLVNINSLDSINITIGADNIFSASNKFISVIYSEASQSIVNPSAFRKFDASLTLNGKVFTNCISVECSAADNCITTGITRYYFSKTKGLAAYIKNGTLWTLK